MLNWPPSPSVEDEATALAHEHLLDASIHSLKSDDQPAPSRGSVDQYPIIIDSDVHRQSEHERQQQQPQLLASEVCSSDDGSGPYTPPPVSRKENVKDRVTNKTSNASHPNPLQSSADAAPVEQFISNRARPQGMHIQTNFSHDDRSQAHHRHGQPPHSYSRMSASQRYNPDKNPVESFLSPTRTAFSPVSVHQTFQEKSAKTSRSSDPAKAQVPEANISARREARSRSRYRGSESNEADRKYDGSNNDTKSSKVRAQSVTRASSRQSFYNNDDKYNDQTKFVTSSDNKRQVSGSAYRSNDRERSETYRPDCSIRSTRDSRDSSYASSSENSPREYRKKANQEPTLQQRRLRRKSSHRGERPHIINLAERNYPETMPTSLNTSPTSYRQGSRTKGSLRPVTPHTADSSKAMEDYFDRAFRENAARRSQAAYLPRPGGSALASPMTTSPPRTPRSERQSRDYFEAASAFQRPAQLSRPPSVDEGQIRDLKLHTSLLSAATTGAAIAAVSAGPSPRTLGQFADPTSSISSFMSNKSAGASGSRRSSPVQENSGVVSRNTSYSSTDSPYLAGWPSASVSEVRPVSRDSRNVATDKQSSVSSCSQLPPHRASSYSGTEQHRALAGSLGVSNSKTAYWPDGNSELLSCNNLVSQSRDVGSPFNSFYIAPPQTTVAKLPICPRSRPSIGYQDWFTIKGISNVDICPTCISVMSNTRYQDLFVPSPSESRRQVTVCAMSNTWVRIAFLQSLRQNRPDLDYIEGVLVLPDRVSECAGDRPDFRRWFDVVDPSTRAPIPNIFACSACAYRIDVVFPSMQKVFARGSSILVEEHTCSLHTTGRSFNSIIDQLEQAELRCSGRRWRSVDIEPLIHQLRKAAWVTSCRRDEMIRGIAWHFMPELPEFTVCEDCYDEVVRPLSDRPIARDVSRTPKTVPAPKYAGNSLGISCQLYSDRMRTVFRDSVFRKDFETLRNWAKVRYEVHQRLHNTDESNGLDWRAGNHRRGEIERNREVWHRVE